MPRILIIEDDEDASEALAKILEIQGHQVRCAFSGSEGLGSIMAQAPDLVVLDLSLPSVHGASVLEIIRADLQLKLLPVVVWTGHDPRDLEKQMDDLTSVVRKGPDFGRILNAVHQALSPAAR